ncbi:MAG: D-cysteine desulfhydrase [Alphaproteobacteria bacterium]|nr:D-cysteine desulfhydrase [Alphaproteobacteria bacterium]
MLDLERFPRADLCHKPTPLESMPRLSEHLQGPRILIKRDDCTGLASGGNKTRKLEFLVGEALVEKADMLVTQGAVQSNHVRQTAAAACRFGMDFHGLLERRVTGAGERYNSSGNVFLDNVFGATLEYRDGGLDMNAEARAVCEKLRGQGRRPYFIPGGGSNPVGALGYVDCARELVEQIDAAKVKVDWIVLATGSTGTHAGLVAGLHALGRDIPVMGISVRQRKEPQEKAVHKLANDTAKIIGASDVPSGKIMVDDGYVGPGYGVPADSTLEAVSLAARRDGILLDPVYTGKGMAGLIGLARKKVFKAGQTVIFLHTGGSAALFAYQDSIEAFGKKK